MAVLFDSGPRPGPDHDEELAGLLASAGTPIAVSHHDGRHSSLRHLYRLWAHNEVGLAE